MLCAAHVTVLCGIRTVAAQGPRVRMGVHWALPGLVACRPHALTKAPMMVGIAVVIAQEVSRKGCSSGVNMSGIPKALTEQLPTPQRPHKMPL